MTSMARDGESAWHRVGLPRVPLLVALRAGFYRDPSTRFDHSPTHDSTGTEELVLFEISDRPVHDAFGLYGTEAA